MEADIYSPSFGVAPILSWVEVDVVVFRWGDKNLVKGRASGRTRQVRYPMSFECIIRSKLSARLEKLRCSFRVTAQRWGLA